MFKTASSGKSAQSAIKIAAILLAAIVVGAAGGPARADIGIVINSDQTYGLLANRGTNYAYGNTGESNPIVLNVGDVSADLTVTGTGVMFNYLIAAADDVASASFANGPKGEQVHYGQPLSFTIVGTADEPQGTPVKIHIHTQFTGKDPYGPTSTVINWLDDTVLDPDSDRFFTGYSVGKTFTYWAFLGEEAGHTASFSGAMSVSLDLGAAPAVPEPGAVAFLSVSGISLLGLIVRRRSKTNRHRAI